MKLSIAAVACVLAPVVYSQTIQSEAAMLPPCSLTCISNAISSVGCSLTDYACQCGVERDSINQAATPCIVANCSLTDALNTHTITEEICSLEAAQGSSSSSASATASPTTSSTGATTTASSIGSSIGSSTGSSIGSSTGSSIGSSVGSSIGSSVVPATTTSTSPTQATSSATSPAATASKAAGGRLEAASAVAGAAILAAFAL